MRKRHAKSWDRSKTRKGGLGNTQVVRKALGLVKIGILAKKREPFDMISEPKESRVSGENPYGR